MDKKVPIILANHKRLSKFHQAEIIQSFQNEDSEIGSHSAICNHLCFSGL